MVCVSDMLFLTDIMHIILNESVCHFHTLKTIQEPDNV